MPNGAGHDADLKHLNACALHADENGTPATPRISSAPSERDHSQQAAALRQQVQRDRRAERQEDRKRQQHHGRLRSNHVDVVGAGGPVHAVSQHQREREHAEADDDRGQDQRLRERDRRTDPLRKGGSAMSGGFARVTPAAARISMLDPFESSPSPMISWASRRRSIRYSPVA